MTGTDSEARSVVVERLMPHPPSKVWRALTQGALLEEWLMATDFLPVVGHGFTFRTAPMPHWDGVIAGEVLEVVPDKRLTYSWNTSGGVTTDGLRTIVTWTLAASDGGTLLRMEQTGFRIGEEANHRGAVYGWERNLGRLDEVLARHG